MVRVSRAREKGGKSGQQRKEQLWMKEWVGKEKRRVVEERKEDQLVDYHVAISVNWSPTLLVDLLPPSFHVTTYSLWHYDQVTQIE